MHTPDLRHMRTVFRVGDVAPAGELIALLPVLTPALAIGLSGNRRVAAAFSPEAPRGEHDIDGAEAVLHPVAVVLDTTRVHQKARRCLAPPGGRLANGTLGNARDL